MVLDGNVGGMRSRGILEFSKLKLQVEPSVQQC